MSTPTGREQSEASPWRGFGILTKFFSELPFAFPSDITMLRITTYCWTTFFKQKLTENFAGRKKRKPEIHPIFLPLLHQYLVNRFPYMPSSALSAPHLFILQLFSALLTSFLSFNKSGIICLEPLNRCFSKSYNPFSTKASRASPALCFCLTPESSPLGILNSRSPGPLAIPGGPHALSHWVSYAFFCLEYPDPTSPLGKSLLTLQDSALRTPRPL